MPQDEITLQNRHKRFIQKVCETEIVYGLKSEDGFATSYSINFEDEDGEAIGLICFWSENAMAKSCTKDNWLPYEVTEISLTEFMESWCIGMNNDGLLAATNFDQNMFGYEIEPLDLILELIQELKSLGKEPEFLQYENLCDLESQINESKSEKE